MVTGYGQRLQTFNSRWSETEDMLQDMVTDCRHVTVNGQRQPTCNRRCLETAEMLEEMIKDCTHVTEEGQRLQNVTEDAETGVHARVYDQRLQTPNSRWSGMAYM